MNIRSEIICIETQYIVDLTNFITAHTEVRPNVKIIKPCLNKQVKHTIYTRPYYCAKFAEESKYVFCWPLSTLKDYDNYSDNKFFFIRHKSKTLGKLALFAPLIVSPKVCRIIPTKVSDRQKDVISDRNWLIKVSLEKKFLDEHYTQLTESQFRVKKNDRIFKIDHNLCYQFLEDYIHNNPVKKIH